ASGPSCLTLPESEALAAVLSGQHGVAPATVLEVPGNRGGKTSVESVRGAPTELPREPGRIDRVTPVVAGAGPDEFPEVRVSAGSRHRESGIDRGWLDRLEGRADRVHDLEVGALVAGADVVAAAGRTLPRDEEQRRAVVLHVKPVAYVAAVPIERQGPALDRVQDHERDQLLRILERPVG